MNFAPVPGPYIVDPMLPFYKSYLKMPVLGFGIESARMGM
jgi:hypothetical protein